MLKKNKEVNKLASVSNIPLPIPAKLFKEVVKISKYFKKSENNGKKLYAQASVNSSNTTRKTLKIKDKHNY